VKIIVAVDSFKGSMTSFEVGRAAEAGVKKAAPDAEIKVFPLSDGGEGFCKTLTDKLGGKIQMVKVAGALGNRVSVVFSEVGNLAIIESATAAGLSLVPKNLRNPTRTTTFGVGEMILQAIKDGCREFIIGLGGSATNDCGLGMLTALGFNFGSGIFGRNLAQVRKIETEKVPPEVFDCKFKIACDVKNPLLGENGCTAVYAPQKGADAKIVEQMEGWIKNFADLTFQTFNIENQSVEGDGAAGGLGFAFRTFLKADLVSGVDLVLEKLNIADDLKDADVLITGEGCIDNQTLQGKVPFGVAKLAKSVNPKIKVIAIGGGVKNISANEIFDATFSILREPVTVEMAMQKILATKNVSMTTEQIIRLLGTKD
jgi:glycerate kinase